MKIILLRQLLLCALLSAGFLSAAQAAQAAQAPHGAQAAEAKDQADVEARLAAARERLEAAAREVAELSGELTDPYTQGFMMAGPPPEPRAILGVTIGAPDEGDKGGVRVNSVTPGGPASKAGIKSGDLLTSIDGRDLRADGKSAGRDLVAYLREKKPGDKVKLQYLRDGKTQAVEVTTGTLNVRPFVHAMPGDRMFTMQLPGTPGAPLPPGAPHAMFMRAFPGAGMSDLELVTLTPKLGQYFGTERGVLVVRAPRESELKLEEGDVIIDIDGRAPQSGAHALRILRSYQQGEKLNLNVLRNHKNLKLALTMPKDAEGRGGAAAFGPMTPGFPATGAEPPDVIFERPVESGT